MNLKFENIKLCVVGLGYVGLPLIVSFSSKTKVVGFDLNQKRISELRKGIDGTNEVPKKKIKNNKNIKFTSNPNDLIGCNCFIISVPTPIKKNKSPDLKMIKNASKMIGKLLTKNCLVIYESTVYPGLTEEICIPILEKFSKLKLNKHFGVGYSPERINPGDKKHRLENILKVTSGSNKKTLTLVDKLYKTIIKAGTFKASSIKVAEAAKVIENTQRDLNIALINELSIVFNKLNISSQEVLEAAKTKWNFIPFKPGLVGGHCIGVDPYYFTYKSKEIGYDPKVILSGRRINDNMGKYISSQIKLSLKKKKINILKSKILILGLSFKENCPDIRNTKVLDIVDELKNKVNKLELYDPIVNFEETKKILNIDLIKNPKKNYYDFILLAVAHNKFKNLGLNKIRKFGKKNCLIYDLKGIAKNNEKKLVDLTL